MFHANNGLFFERLEDGGVHVIHQVPGVTLADWTMTASEWASVVASMSAQGENATTWHSALNFHQGR